MDVKLATSLRAGYTFFYVQTYEMDRAVENVLDEIKTIEQVDWKVKVWDFEIGDGDPDQVIQMLGSEPEYTAVVAKNFNWFFNSPDGSVNYEYIQFIQNRFAEFSSRETRKALIVLNDLSFNEAIPPCLAKEFITISFSLPDKKEVSEILDGIIEAASKNPKFKRPKEEDKADLIEAALGLTKRGVSNAFAYSIVNGGGAMDAKVVASMRAAEVNETSGLTVWNGDVGDIKGYNKTKEFARRALKNPKSRGMLLLGPPGVGKTHFAKWCSTISNKTMIEQEMAGVQGEGLYGQAENAMRAAIDVVKSIRNCILFVDELEKAVPGKGATNDTTGTRSFGQFLKFLSDGRPDGCFVIATCNDITKLPPEWVRSGRFDVIFFADLPSDEEKQAIYDHYRKEFGVEAGGFSVKNMKDWTGAEIESACRIASVLGGTVKDGAEYVVPIADTMKADIEGLRKWSKGRTIPAHVEEVKTKKRVRTLDV
jgi:AAA+ superfamily predicted ATPase